MNGRHFKNISSEGINGHWANTQLLAGNVPCKHMHGTFVVLLLFPSSRESEIGGVTDKNSALNGRICYLLPLKRCYCNGSMHSIYSL